MTPSLFIRRQSGSDVVKGFDSEEACHEDSLQGRGRTELQAKQVFIENRRDHRLAIVELVPFALPQCGALAGVFDFSFQIIFLGRDQAVAIVVCLLIRFAYKANS